MSPYAINRRLLWVVVGAAGAGAYLYVRHRLDSLRQQEGTSERDVSAGTSSSTGPAGATTTAKDPAEGSSGVTAEGAPATEGAPSEVHTGPAGEKELSEFLAGDSWYDESGWRGIWEREGVADAAAWLRKEGKAVLRRARESLKDHPALLAGCRRRWIVVCRYAGIDVSDAAALWNETDG